MVVPLLFLFMRGSCRQMGDDIACLLVPLKISLFLPCFQFKKHVYNYFCQTYPLFAQINPTYIPCSLEMNGHVMLLP